MVDGSKILNFYDVRKKSVTKAGTMDKSEFMEIIQQYKVPLYRLAKGIVKNEHDTEDAINETILKAYENLKKLKNKDSFKSWIMRILVNECYGLINKKNKIDLQENMEVYKLTYEDKNIYELMDEINKLDMDFRTVLILFYYEDMSIKAISEVLNISQGTVKSRLSRAKNKLRGLLDKC
ncbi:RNA polymerase sigma factor [Clostridium frigidicarnis]|uniref:RNA polymerase sigma-70 factor, ECF subfamily n=1 Tax=Clostridium frigidicarnis TaxID=84698 RepID=A0A1I0X6Y5_9CLOT|nr:sigma-70 family RNA polymerase sigma factor [Clostridium frigidicarnis]SFA96765.1 RNA polymerase sigma-70 factor, ECF subfamily [Clostridium frigidicarnis]